MQPVHQPDLRRFVMAYPEGDALLMYEEDTTSIVFIHTFVPQELRGRGIAEKLMRAGLGWARTTGKVIHATCSYAQVFLERERAAQTTQTKSQQTS
ncbi:GNAT family N-acetyltransferase [Nibricoccus sp. IMCC34717]|uniref:GNAT family N-acetyltransferase n=1 Tax=Nibricoccus sp. IMCC34717 TaxID=3034021 RepID=UPI00384F51AE